MTAQQLFSGLQKMYSGISDEQFENYISTIFRYKGKKENVQINYIQFVIDEVDFKINHHPYYLYENEKN